MINARPSKKMKSRIGLRMAQSLILSAARRPLLAPSFRQSESSGDQLRRSRRLVEPRAALRVQPKLDDACVDGKADPERNAEELAGAKMRAGTGSEEYAHDGTSRCDTEQDTHGAGHPLPLWRGLAAKAKPICTAQREQEPGVEDKDGGALHPAADGPVAHCVGGGASNRSEGKEEPLQPFAASAAQQDSGGEQHEDGRRNDVHYSQGGVRGKGRVERRHLRRAAVRRTDQLDKSADNNGDGDNDAEPEPREKPERMRSEEHTSE